MQENIRILFVDDDKNLLDTFSMALEDYGYQIKTASNPDEALRYVSDEPFDIVFIDMYLGDTHGTDLMKDMSGMKKGLHFVIATGNGSVPLAVESLQKGASDFITKPLFASDIVRSIEYVKKKRQFEKERDIIKNHPQTGVDILEPVKQFKSILPTRLHHHEYYDGSGYPHGLSGEDMTIIQNPLNKYSS